MSLKTYSNLEICAAFNKLKKKPYMSLKDMQLKKAYTVKRLIRQTTRFGSALVAELKDCMVYLPKRYSELDNDILDGVKSEKFTLSKILDDDNTNFIFELEIRPEITAEDEEDGDHTMFVPHAQQFFSWEPNKTAKY